MANGGSIKYNIGFNVDKTGLNQLKSSLQEIKAMTATDLMKIGGHNDIEKANNDLKELQKSIQLIDGALERAFNTDLGTLNVAKFNQELSKMNLNKVYGDFKNAGAAGQAAFRNTTAQILTTNMQLKQTHSLLDNMATTMANTIKWGAASSVMNTFTGSVQKAYGYVKNLDTSLNDIMIVTGKNADEMERFAVQANNAAKSLGQSTTNYTEASLIYYQQGLSDEEVKARAETTLKAANVTGQTGAEVSEQLTAVWNGYKVSAEEAELYVDKLAAVAATTAADLEELSVGMSKVASAANLMGVDVDQLNAQLATIVSVTRQAPESVGTALKTIYARMGDIEAGLDSEVSLGDYTEKMAAMGVNVLDMNGELRDMGEVIEEIGGKWTSMSREQQVYLSQVMAGTRQYNNLLSLFDNWDMYTSALDTSENSMGTLQEQQDIYMESTAAHLATLKATWEDLYDSLLDPKSINTVVDGLTTVVDLLGNFVDSIGGGIGVLGILGSVGMQVFSKQIASSLATTIMNMQAAKQNVQQLQAEMEILNQFENADIDDVKTQRLIEMKRQQLDLTKSLTTEERNISNEYIKQQNALHEQQDELSNRLTNAQDVYERMTGNTVQLDTKEQRQAFAGTKNTEGLIDTEIRAIDSLKQGIKETDSAYQNLMQSIRQKSKASEEDIEIVNNQIDAADEFVRLNQANKQDREALNKALDNYNNIVKDKSKFDINNRKHLEALREVQDAYKRAVNNTSTDLKKAKQNIQTYDDAVKNNNANVKNLTQSWNNFIKQIDLRNKIQQGIQLASSLGQVASAISSIGRIPDIWSDNDLTVGEKLLQTVTNLGFALPMLTNSLGKVNSVLGITKAFTTAAATAKMTYIAATKAATLSETQLAIAQQATSNLVKMGISYETAYALAINKTTLSKAKQAEINAIVAQLIRKEITAEAADIAIKEVLTAANIKVGVSLKAAATGVKAFMSSLGPLGWAVLGVTAAFAAFTISAEGAREALEESSKEYDEAISKLDELETSLDGVNSKLEELYSKDTLTITDEQDIHNLEQEKLLLEQQLEVQKEINKEKLKEKVGDIEQTIKSDSYEYKGRAGTFTYYDAIGPTTTEIDMADEEGFNSWIEEGKESYRQALLANPQSYGIELITDENGAIIQAEVDKQIEDWLTSWEKSSREEYKMMQEDYKKSMQNDYETMMNNLSVLKEGGGSQESIEYVQNWLADYYNFSGLMSQMTTKAFDNAIGDTTRARTLQSNLVSRGGAEKEWDAATLSQAGFLEDEIEKLQQSADIAGVSLDHVIDQFIELGDAGLVDSIEYTTEKFKDLVEETLGNDIDYNQYEEGVNSYLQQLANEGYSFSEINSALETVDLQSIDWSAAAEDVNSYQSVIKRALEEQSLLQLKNGEILAKNASDLQGAISSGSYEELDEDQKAALTELENKYEELRNIRNKSSHEYLEKLREIAEVEEENAKRALILEREKAEAKMESHLKEIERYEELKNKENKDARDIAELQKIDIEAEVSGFEEAMENLHENYSQMEVQIEADFQSDIDSAFGLADEIGKLQDLVQDDLTVTFEEAQELINQGYAEILRNSQETNEQTILLDKATMNSFIDSRQQELEASRQAKLADIEMQRAVLLEQEAALQTEIDAYTAAANSKSAISAAEALNDAKNAHATYESKVLEYNDLLSKSSDTASEEEGINEELYNSLSQMYTDDSLNQQNAEQSATDTQKSNIENRIANVHQLHAAYRALGQQILATEQNPGQAVALGGTGALEGGVSIETPEIISVEGTGDYGYEEVTAKDLEQFFTGDEANTEFKATMEAMAEKAAAEQKVVRERLSALDAAEAALKSADISLDKAQADAKKGGSKSGSGSSDKEKDPDYMESLNEERDIYHDINYELEKINDKIAKQERLTSKLTGKQRIDALEKEIELLKEQADLEETKLAMLQNEQATLRDKLSKDEDTTVAFDAEGDIANYNEALAQKEAAVNAIIARYNAMSAEEQEAFKSTVEAAKEEYEQFKEDMERYEEIITQDIVESQDNINNLLDQQIEKQIEQFELEIELKIDTREAERQFQDFIKNHVKNIDDEDYAGLAQFSLDQIKTYTGAGGDLNTYETAMNTALSDYNKIMAGGTGSVYGDDATAALEAYEKYRDLVYDTYGEIGDLIDEVRDAELDGIDAANDKFDEQLEKYDQIEDSLNRRLELSQLLSGEEDYETQLKYQEQMKQNNLERQQLLQQEIATYEKHLAYLEASGRGNSEAAESLAEKLQEAQEQLAETTAESLELIAESYETKKKQLIQDMNTEVTGGLGLDYINQEWELINENADMYLDTINSAFELSQLESKMLDAIDNTEGLAAQERLNSLMDEELGKLREKEKLTQYDVDRANKLFDIELKRIALEEAQASKTQMRLRRDSQGNYTYQYVADQNKVAEAERELAEAENELYNMDKDAYKDNLDELKSAYEEYIDEVNELSILYKDNQEEFYRQLALLTEKYGERIGGLTDQNIDIGFNLQGSALAEVAKMTGANIEDLENMSQEDIDSLMATIVPQWSSGVAEMVTKLANGGFGEMANEIANMFIQLQKDQQEEMENAAAAGGESLDEIASGADIVSQKFGEIDTETQEIVTSLDTMLISLSQNVTAAEKFADNLKEAAEASANIISQGNAAIYGTEDFVSLGATDGLSASSIAKTEVAKRVDSIDTELVRLHGGVDNSVSPAMEEALKIVQVAQKVETLKSLQSPKTNTISSYQAAFEQMQQKQDVITLSPIKSIESFIENLQSSISQRAFQLENQLLFDKLDKLISEQEAEKLEQMVHITADFPGVSSTAEIEEAFNNLINAASQYAFRTERK